MKPQNPSPEYHDTANNLPELNKAQNTEKPVEIGGFAAEGLKEPTRYGDWDVRGRCSDF